MDDHSSHRFSSGLELGNFIATSDLLEHSWKAITKLRTEITAPIYLAFYGYYNERSNCKIVAFVTNPNCTENPLEEDGGEDLVSLSTLLNDEFTAFEFLPTKIFSDSAINGVALDLFRRFYPVYEQEISRLISNPKTQLIITGHALGGSVASLFTLLLLDSIDLTRTKRPLCITFGSPLLGNEAFQNAISQFSTWSSCFLHLVSNQDPLPRKFLNNKAYYPFGTFLFCSRFGDCSCFEDQKSILKLLGATKASNVLLTASSFFDYKETIDRLIKQVNLKATMKMVSENAESWIGSFVAQLEAIGVAQNKLEQQRVVDVNRLAEALKDNEMKLILENTKPFGRFAKTLNVVKINMAILECYKKKCKLDNIGYYDSYRNQRSEIDFRVAEFKKNLQVFWENKVEEAERKPLRDGAPFNVQLLFGGTNFRRMVEPLDIAEHYRKGLTDYKSHRPKHYTKLEQWFKESATPDSSSMQREAVSSILTVDSLFWEHVEEAVLACNVLKEVDCSEEEREAELAKLREFEDYVVESMKNYAVSSEIFLPQSTFMRWWKEYDEIVGDDHDSVLSRLMRNEEYEEYANGRSRMSTAFKILEADRFPGQVTSLAHIANANKTVKEKLTPKQLEMFRRTVFGQFVDIDIVFNSPLIHHMLLREVKSSREDSMSFSVRGTVVTFSKDEFLLMTGLWHVPTQVVQNEESSENLETKYFGNWSRPNSFHINLLEEEYKKLEFENDNDAVKITLVYYTEVAMMGKNKQKCTVERRRFKEVEDLEYYNSLDWGNIIWERTLEGLKTALRDKVALYKNKVKSNKNFVVKYSLCGFPQAFQVWTYEILSSIAGRIATRRSKVAVPRILRWSCSHSVPFRDVQRDIFESQNTIVNELLVMSHAEREFQDTPVNRRPIHEAGNDADSSNSGDGGDDDNHSGRNDDEDDDGDLHNMNTNEPTYTHNVDDIHESEMGHVYEDDVMNLSVSLGHEEERFEPSNFAHREGVNVAPNVCSYLQSIDSWISMLDGRVSNVEEDLSYVKAQLSTITSLLQALCKIPTDVLSLPLPPEDPAATRSSPPPLPSAPDTTRSPTPPPSLDATRSSPPPHLHLRCSMPQGH